MADIIPEQVIPHRGRMKLVDAVVDIEDGAAVTVSRVTDQWPLVEGDGVNPLVLIELAAQTSAITIGWPLLKAGGRAVQGRGLLVGIKSAVFDIQAIPMNSRITTRAVVNFKMDSYTEITGVSTLNGRRIGEVTLQTVRTDEETAND
jgi:predicted hotdog family 3-hydroxylacyl-ACP dehydratase